MGSSLESALSLIRGSLPRARANARTVAALTDNPGCTRRRVIDAAAIPAYELAAQLGYPVTRGQSPFAITNGNRFEYRLKEGSKYSLLVEALKPFIDLPTDGLRWIDLGKKKGQRIGVAWLESRARQTEEVLAKIARGDADAPHIVDHPVLVFDLAGADVFLEPDALAFRVGRELQLVEIKSYAIIDGQADPAKVSATAGQSAVYVLALRATLRRLGFDPDMLRWSVILVAPKNFGRTPVAHEIPLRKKSMALQRVLGSAPRAEEILGELPRGFTLDVGCKGGETEAAHPQKLDRAVRALSMLYVPECLSTCDMGRYCRHQALIDDDPARLGRTARDNLAGVPTLDDALRLAREGVRPSERALADVAEALQEAMAALTRARSLAPDTVPSMSGKASVRPKSKRPSVPPASKRSSAPPKSRGKRTPPNSKGPRRR